MCNITDISERSVSDYYKIRIDNKTYIYEYSSIRFYYMTFIDICHDGEIATNTCRSINVIVAEDGRCGSVYIFDTICTSDSCEAKVKEIEIPDTIREKVVRLIRDVGYDIGESNVLSQIEYFLKELAFLLKRRSLAVL